MATRTTTKQGRSLSKSITKIPGKDQVKQDRQGSSVLEIVPGKFNENDWLALLEIDDTEDFIADIVESIWTEVSKRIGEIYIQRQLLPYTIVMTENALSNVIQWAFLEKDTPHAIDDCFLMMDTEPFACTMDNWGEGVVPACREENSIGIEDKSSSVSDLRQNVPVQTGFIEKPSWLERPLTNFSVLSSTHKSRSTTQIKSPLNVQPTDRSVEPVQENIFTTPTDEIERRDTQLKEEMEPLDLQKSQYRHDMLVIDTHPPKLEPMSRLFFTNEMRSTKSGSQSNITTNLSKYRQPIVSHVSSQLGSAALSTATGKTSTLLSSTQRRKNDSKLFKDENIDEIISKAPVASHAVLKGILSRPQGYRQLELDEFGQVTMISKIDPDRMPHRNVRVKCNIVKKRKDSIDSKLPKVNNQIHRFHDSRPDSKYTSVKLVLPEQSTDVGDLIQPVPGVIYEDARLKKGDPRRYQSGLSKYKKFHDESRSLKPIAPKKDSTILEQANDFLRLIKTQNEDEQTNSDLKVTQMHRFNPIPSISSKTDTSA